MKKLPKAISPETCIAYQPTSAFTAMWITGIDEMNDRVRIASVYYIDENLPVKLYERWYNVHVNAKGSLYIVRYRRREYLENFMRRGNKTC